MPKNYDSVDLHMTYDGDFLVDQYGDLQDTSDDLLLSLKTEVFSYIKSSLQDWREEPGIGAGLDDFIGEPNNSNTGKALEQRIKSSLINLVSSSDIQVKVVPVGPHRVLTTIYLLVAATPENGVRPGDLLTITFLYDYLERGVFASIEDNSKFGGRTIGR